MSNPSYIKHEFLPLFFASKDFEHTVKFGLGLPPWVIKTQKVNMPWKDINKGH